MSQPLIFLSHAGEDSIVPYLLCEELKKANHKVSVFLDKKSLQPGDSIITEILENIKNTRVAVVVLSEKFVTKRWPMMELQHLVEDWEKREKTANPLTIIPVFHTLTPTDLSNPIKLQLWSKQWEQIQKKNDGMEENFQEKNEGIEEYFGGMEISKSITGKQTTSSKRSRKLPLKTKHWQAALQKLADFAGNTSTPSEAAKILDQKEEVKRLVRQICSIFPPPLRFFSAEKVPCIWNVGYERIAKKISSEIERIKGNSKGSVIKLGVYGVAGSGKTTLCKIMVDFYLQEYGQFYLQPQWLEIPDFTQNNPQKLINNLKVVIKVLTSASDQLINSITDLNQAVTTFIDMIQNLGRPVFVALDNVCESSRYNVERMLRGMSEGSVVIITSRNRKILQLLGCRDENIMAVPVLNEDEAWEAFLGYIHSIDKLVLLKDTNTKRIANEIYSFLDGSHPNMLYAVAKRLLQVVDDVEALRNNVEALHSNITELRESRFSDAADEVKRAVKSALRKHDTNIKKQILDKILSRIAVLFPAVTDEDEGIQRCNYICIRSEEVEPELEEITIHRERQHIWYMWNIEKDLVNTHTNLHWYPGDPQPHDNSIKHYVIIDGCCKDRKWNVWGIQAASHHVYQSATLSLGPPY